MFSFLMIAYRQLFSMAMKTIRCHPDPPKRRGRISLGIILANGLDPDQILISFKEIGKTSRAHKIAIKSFRQKKADKKITVKDILSVL